MQILLLSSLVCAVLALNSSDGESLKLSKNYEGVDHKTTIRPITLPPNSRRQRLPILSRERTPRTHAPRPSTTRSTRPRRQLSEKISYWRGGPERPPTPTTTTMRPRRPRRQY